MKLAFSTLSCPEWTLDEILEVAVQHNYDGIEFRGLLDQVDLTNVPEFSPARIADTRKRLEDAGIKAACLSSSVGVAAAMATEVDRRQAMAHTRLYVDMAKEVGAPFVRLFGGQIPTTMERAEVIDRASVILRELGDFAQERGVTLVIETHDHFIRTEELMELIRAANHRSVQALWDIHHPYRLAGESIQHSMNYLDGHVLHTHVKDSVLNTDGEGYTYRPLGEGDIPIQEALEALKKSGYDGYLALEWEKRWIPDLDGPEMVIPHYAETMRAWLAEM